MLFSTLVVETGLYTEQYINLLFLKSVKMRTAFSMKMEIEIDQMKEKRFFEKRFNKEISVKDFL